MKLRCEEAAFRITKKFGIQVPNIVISAWLFVAEHAETALKHS